MSDTLRIHQIRCPVDRKLNENDIASKLHCSVSDILSFEIERQSLDARKDLHDSYTVLARVRNAHRYLKKKDVSEGKKEVYTMPPFRKTPCARPVIVGFGPAGMFAGLILAECGFEPIILERGRCVEEREKDVQAFFEHGILNPSSNVQYGEGGAGTFSDGKLTTRIHNIRIQKVLEEFVQAGADPAITYQHRPHIGTDALRTVVRNIRNRIISLGGEIRFETQMVSLRKEGNTITGVVTDQGVIPCERVILCAGHSASDTYETLYDQGVVMVQKDFAAGVRVEHPQDLINRRQYGKYHDHPALSAASYRLAHTASNGRGVYSFCMCPGGVVVPASCVENTLAVNGMSYAARDGEYANSAILVQIPSADFNHGHPLDGFAYQKQLEKLAFRTAYQAPAMNIRDYVSHQVSQSPVHGTSYPRGLIFEDMHGLFSLEVNSAMEEGFLSFDHKIPGFIDQGIMVGMESRSSSPIRIPRNDSGESMSVSGLYPCGEGAGYAGGIISSAVDGIHQAEMVIASLQ
ncbi:MAG: NAD(P)/FAD-dependent oxidoreductase [Bulleidia sp.]